MDTPPSPRPGLRPDPALAAELESEAARRGRRLAQALVGYGILVAAGVLLAGFGIARWPLLVLVSLAFVLPLAVVLSRPRPRRCGCGAGFAETRLDGVEWLVCEGCGRCARTGSQPD
jgi:hypothetical protein